MLSSGDDEDYDADAAGPPGQRVHNLEPESPFSGGGDVDTETSELSRDSGEFSASYDEEIPLAVPGACARGCGRRGARC